MIKFSKFPKTICIFSIVKKKEEVFLIKPYHVIKKYVKSVSTNFLKYSNSLRANKFKQHIEKAWCRSLTKGLVREVK